MLRYTASTSTVHGPVFVVKQKLHEPVCIVVQSCVSELVFVREKYVRELREWIGVDVYGRCGSLTCGKVQNVLHEYDPDIDPCFTQVNSKYR
jgi:hypothetical protein